MYKFLIKILSLRFLNSTKRKEYRNAKLANHINKLNAKHKWGVSYSVFDGHELLEKSILSIRESVDYINVVYQTTSWYGNKCDDDLLPTLCRLKDAGLIDELIEYPYIHKANRSGHAPKYEKQKRTLGLEAAKKAKCTYFMTMDCDEFYFKDELENAKKHILLNNVSHSYVLIYHYVLEPIYRKLNAEYYVPFFSKINIYSSFIPFHFEHFYICNADPTRILNKYLLFKFLFIKIYGKYRPFILPNIAMHHMSSIRKNIMSKINNSSDEHAQNKILHSYNNALKEIEKIKNGEGSCNIILVKNYFHINIK